MPASQEERIRLLCEQFRTLDMQTIMSCFTDDVEVHYNDLPVLHGRAALYEFLGPRYSQLKHYQLSKKVVLEQGDDVCVAVHATYSEGGRNYRSTILEVLTFVNERIAKWVYVGHARVVE